MHRQIELSNSDASVSDTEQLKDGAQARDKGQDQQQDQNQNQEKDLLSTPIRDLKLKIEGSPLQKYVDRLYAELEQKKLLKFRPNCYLTDEWGCPSGEPVIGIPFYLASAELSRLEEEMNDLETGREVMMFLRHEAGHAFNYAYRLHRTPEWKQLFGSFRRPYRDHYRPVPFSKEYVRHMAGWYAQKHPDEDFAETFAVWLTPRSGWKTKYRGWGAMTKLRYMERIARELGNADPARKRGVPDVTVDEMEATVGEFYQKSSEEIPMIDLALDTDLRNIFDASRRRKSVKPAQEFLRLNRKTVVDKIAYWTGVQRPLVRRLAEAIEKRAGELRLYADTQRTSEHLTNVAVYATALAANYMARGKFILS